ncbi:MAG: hypothetical protein JF599_11965 [Verrucomicrobia bacterium]|nr:hypothetical protein [Verrucomicrobiota bacterium]
MNPPAPASPAQEINRLHQEVVRQTGDSKKCLHAALVAAWQAGQLLLAEQKRVYRTMGAAWGFWLEQNFKGSRRTAQNYMRLAESVADVSEFQGLSLRQVYLRLGIATEPKSRTDSPHVEKLPAHIRLANRLLETLNTHDKTPQASPELFRQDLRALYDRLRRLFEPSPSENLNGSSLSKKNQP